MNKTQNIIFVIITSLVTFLMFPFMNKNFLNPIGVWLFADINPTVINDVIILAIGILTSVILYRRTRTKNIVAIGRIIVPFIILYILIRSENNLTSFSFCDKIRYSDTLLLLVIALIVKYFTVKPNKDEVKETDIDLEFDDNDADDILNREKEAEIFVEKIIKNINPNGATGVSITGHWGSGKSWFLKKIDEYLSKKQCSVIHFKPWLYKENCDLEFLSSLENYFLSKDNNISKQIKRYIKTLSNANIHIISFIALNIDSFLCNKTAEQHFNIIKERVKNYNKPIFVLMDDCDRLEKDELKSVLNLIRNTADFPNIVYISAFSKNYVATLLRNTGGVDYMKKMFNINYSLHSLSNSEIKTALIQLLKTHKIQDFDNRIFDDLELNHYLPTLRDIKWFWNTYNIDYEERKELFDNFYVDDGNFILIELLKFTDYEMYETLRKNPKSILTEYSNNYGKFYKYEQNTNNILTEQTEKLLKCIFNNQVSDNKSIARINNIYHYHIYFDLTPKADIISDKEFLNFLSQDNKTATIQTWIKQNKTNFISELALLYRYEIEKRVDLYDIIEKYIWYYCESRKTKNTNLESLIRGLKGDETHYYNYIRDFVEQNCELQDIMFQTILQTKSTTNNELDFFEDDITEHIRQTEYLYELPALLNVYIKKDYISDGMYFVPERFLEEIFEILIQKNDRIIDINLLDILFDCIDKPFVEKFVTKILKQDILRWLSLTIRYYSVDGNKYILLRHREMQVLFNTEKECVSLLQSIETTENKEIINEFFTVMEGIKRAKNISNNDIILPFVNIEECKILNKVDVSEIDALLPQSEIIKQLNESNFWNNIPLRQEPEELHFYFKDTI